MGHDGVTTIPASPLPEPNRNRRAILAVLATLPLATGAVAAIEPNPDAKLLALGQQVDAAIVAYMAHEPAYFAADAAFARSPTPEANEALEAARVRAEALSDACGALGEQLLEIEPRTLAGAAVIARIVHHEWRQCWEKPARREYDEATLVALVDAVLALANAGVGQPKLGSGNRGRIAQSAATVSA